MANWRCSLFARRVFGADPWCPASFRNGESGTRLLWCECRTGRAAASFLGAGPVLGGRAVCYMVAMQHPKPLLEPNAHGKHALVSSSKLAKAFFDTLLLFFWKELA